MLLYSFSLFVMVTCNKGQFVAFFSLFTLSFFHIFIVRRRLTYIVFAYLSHLFIIKSIIELDSSSINGNFLGFVFSFIFFLSPHVGFFEPSNSIFYQFMYHSFFFFVLSFSLSLSAIDRRAALEMQKNSNLAYAKNKRISMIPMQCFPPHTLFRAPNSPVRNPTILSFRNEKSIELGLFGQFRKRRRQLPKSTGHLLHLSFGRIRKRCGTG